MLDVLESSIVERPRIEAAFRSRGTHACGVASILFPEIRELKIGESMMVPRGDTKNRKAWTRYYGMAKAAGIRVSLKTIDQKTMRLTRVA